MLSMVHVEYTLTILFFSCLGIMVTSKLTIRSQITIPKIVREKLKVYPGDIVVFIEKTEK